MKANTILLSSCILNSRMQFEKLLKNNKKTTVTYISGKALFVPTADRIVFKY